MPSPQAIESFFPLISFIQCLPSLKAEPYLLNDEETYEPPVDPDSGWIPFVSSQWFHHLQPIIGLSLEELGMRALSRIPRDRALDGIHAFNAMRYVGNQQMS